MSIEEIISVTLNKESWDAFREIMAAVESEAATWEALEEIKIFHRLSEESFRLERGNVKVIVNRKLRNLTWARLEQINTATLPVKDTGELDLEAGCYGLHGQQFSSMKEAALYLVGKLS
jgi:hypothetical protein